MRDVYQEQLWNLNQELIQMGAACEEIIDLASKALTDYSQALAEETAHVGSTIDESERTIETICLKLLLRQQPVASADQRGHEDDHRHGTHWRSG